MAMEQLEQVPEQNGSATVVFVTNGGSNGQPVAETELCKPEEETFMFNPDASEFKPACNLVLESEQFTEPEPAEYCHPGGIVEYAPTPQFLLPSPPFQPEFGQQSESGSDNYSEEESYYEGTDDYNNSFNYPNIQYVPVNQAQHYQLPQLNNNNPVHNNVWNGSMGFEGMGMIGNKVPPVSQSQYKADWFGGSGDNTSIELIPHYSHLQSNGEGAHVGGSNNNNFQFVPHYFQGQAQSPTSSHSHKPKPMRTKKNKTFSTSSVNRQQHPPYNFATPTPGGGLLPTPSVRTPRMVPPPQMSMAAYGMQPPIMTIPNSNGSAAPAPPPPPANNGTPLQPVQCTPLYGFIGFTQQPYQASTNISVHTNPTFVNPTMIQQPMMNGVGKDCYTTPTPQPCAPFPAIHQTVQVPQGFLPPQQQHHHYHENQRFRAPYMVQEQPSIPVRPPPQCPVPPAPFPTFQTTDHPRQAVCVFVPNVANPLDASQKGMPSLIPMILPNMQPPM